MASDTKFKFYLVERVNPTTVNYYIENGAGNIVTTPTKTDIGKAPKGWIEQELRWSRNWFHYGILSAYVIPLEFVGLGGKIVKHLYYTGGIISNLEFQIEIMNPTDESYSLMFRGKVALIDIEDMKSKYSVKVVIKNENYVEKLNARERTNYEIPVDGNPDSVYVYMDGLDLKHSVTWTTILEPIQASTGNPDLKFTTFGDSGNISSLNSGFLMIQYLVIGTDGYTNDGVKYQDFNPIINAPVVGLPPMVIVNSVVPNEIAANRDDDWMLFNDTPIDRDVTIDLKDVIVFFGIQNTSDISGTFDIIAIRADVNAPFQVKAREVLYSHAPVIPIGSSTQTAPINSTTTITLGAGEGLWLCFAAHSGGVGTGTGEAYFRMLEGGTICATYFNKVSPTYIQALRPNDVFGELVNQISDGDTTHNSTVLGNDLEQFVIASGDSLRNLADSVIKTNFENFFNSYNRIFNLAGYYDPTANEHVILNKADVFDASSLIIDIGEVADLKVTHLNDRMFSRILMGYNDYTYDELNGRDEPNSTSEYKTPIIDSNETKDMRSPYRADPFGIEFTRANLVDKETTDADSDNDNFILHIEDTQAGTYLGKPFYNLYREAVPPYIINNIISPETIFNIELSPRRNFNRNAEYIRSYLHLMDSETVTFQTSLKNGDMETDDGTTVITENADFPIAQMGNALFAPVLFRCQGKLAIDFQDIVDNNRLGRIDFTYDGLSLQGFILDAGLNPETRKQPDLILLATINNPFSDLENI